jgi:hypothetical protein
MANCYQLRVCSTKEGVSGRIQSNADLNQGTQLPPRASISGEAWTLTGMRWDTGGWIGRRISK